MDVGDPSTDLLLETVYEELRRLAAYHLSGERKNFSLQATALVHEVYLRLAPQKSAHWRDRTHFLSLASEMMRRVLVDQARARMREKRGGGAANVSLAEASELGNGRDIEVLHLDLAMGRLAEIDPRKAKLVQFRYFGGLTIEEIAEVLGTSVATAERDWRFSRAFLRRELGSTERSQEGV